MSLLQEITLADARRKRPGNDAPLSVSRLNSIHDIEARLWDSINDRHDLFHTHRFISAVEDAHIENSKPFYLLFHKGNRLVGTAALSAFDVSLDLFTSKTVQRQVSGFRRLFPRFMKVKILFCGLPVSLGKNAIGSADDTTAGQMIDLLVKEMVSIAGEENIRYLCVKEFLEDELKIFGRFSDHGFIKADSIPYISLELKSANFDNYVSSMRHSYRRQLLSCLRMLDHHEPVMIKKADTTADDSRTIIAVTGVEHCSPEKFFELYKQVMYRAKAKLEILNLSFFRNFHDNMKKDHEIVCVMKGSEVICSSLLTVKDDVMTFMLTGINYASKYAHIAYCNLVSGIIMRAFQRGCSRLDMGQTSYGLKQRLGGVCTPQYFFIRAESGIVQFLIKAFRKVLFPEQKIVPRRTFNQSISFAGDPRGINKKPPGL